jgi:Ni/Co efflux regulator RcnB
MTNSLMKSSLGRTARTAALMAAMALACTASLAEKPDWAGGGGKGDHDGQHGQKNDPYSVHDQHQREHGRQDKHDGPDRRAGDVRVGGYFGDQQRSVVSSYYGEQFKGGRCPPGLAKKHNGCMPPGQAKKYTVGQRLPRDVVYYTVPPTMSVQLGVPPSGYKYVRVASDILLIAVGTSMVVDAIQDLGRL